MAETIFCVNKETGNVHRVYDITYNKNGYPHFLIFDDGVWARKSAKHFIPAEIVMGIDEEYTCAGDCRQCGDEACALEIL